MAQLTTQEQFDKGMELLNKLLALQTAVDGIERAPVDKYGPLNDELRNAAHEVSLLLLAATQAVPLMDSLAAHGRVLESEGKITIEYGDSYAVAALNHLLMK